MLVCRIYITRLKQFKPWQIPIVVSNIKVVDALICCILLHSECDLKNAQMKLETYSFEFELGHNAVEATKNICCVEDEGAIDHSTISRWPKKFHSDYKNFNDQAKSGRFKTMGSVVRLQVREVNLASSIWRVSDELGMSQASIAHHFHNLDNSVWSSQIVPYFIKILQNFCLPLAAFNKLIIIVFFLSFILISKIINWS